MTYKIGQRYFLMIILFVFFFQGIIYAKPNLQKDPDWLVDEELSGHIDGWNEGVIKCMPPTGGYNVLTDKQTILNSWGYKARPMEEIKHLLPGPQYELFNHPEIWGTFRINETDYNAAAPRGAKWEKYLTSSKKNIGVVSVDEKGGLRKYSNGIPFPELDEKDPMIGIKLIWNYYKRFQGDDRIVLIDITTKDRRGGERHNLIDQRRMRMNGRNNAHHPIYSPNPKKIDYFYTAIYVAPYNLRGTLPLYYRYLDPDKSDDMWIYIPSIRRVRRMSTAQHQDRFPGGLDWTYDSTEGFEGKVNNFIWSFLGRKELLNPVLSHNHCYFNPKGFLNGMDQYYQRRNCYVIKATYKSPINMHEMILYLDPELYSCCFSVDTDIKGRNWIVQCIHNGRDKDWYYTMYTDFAADILRKHVSRACFAHSGNNQRYESKDFTMDNLKKIFLAR